MKAVSILISNYNSYDVLRLCIESILERTDYPNYEIIVHDDESPNGVDIKYLQKMVEGGWIQLIRGNRKRWVDEYESWSPLGHPASYWHGCALNVLINETCRTELAMIVDCDVFIKEPDWLMGMVKVMDEKTLVSAYLVHPRHNVEWPTGRGGLKFFYVPGWYRMSFGMINMAAYHDGMEVDWRGGSSDIQNEPYKTILGYLVKEREGTGISETAVRFDPGCSLWTKMQTDNPKGYVGRPLPADMEGKFHHFEQISVRGVGMMDWRNDERFSLLSKEHQKYFGKQMDLIRDELAKLE